MKLSVTGRHVAVTEAIHTEITRRLRPLERVLNDNVVSGQCVVGRERQVFVCEITLHARGDHMLHAVGRDSRVGQAVAQAVERVGQQGQRLTDRWKTRKRGSSARRESPPVDREPSTAPRVVRSRDYAVKPLTLDDAVLELSANGRPLLVFRDAVSDHIAVLFRRPDGRFGLIEPED